MATSLGSQPQDALAAYEALAPFYDAFTAGYEHERWIAALERLALRNGLAGRRLLDVACGTGKSFLPFLERGYDVTACDVSPGMLEQAQAKLRDGQAELVRADMRELPRLGAFDLVICLDDAVNYLGSPAELEAAIRGMALNLGPRGLLVFDVNSRCTYERTFAQTAVREAGGHLFVWRPAQPGPGSEDRHAAVLDVFAEVPGGLYSRASSRHVQRHFDRSEVQSALDAAGLSLLARRGQLSGGRLERTVDEARHSKIVHLASAVPDEVQGR